MDSEGILQKEDPHSNNVNADAMAEDMLQEVYDKATEVSFFSESIVNEKFSICCEVSSVSFSDL